MSSGSVDNSKQIEVTRLPCPPAHTHTEWPGHPLAQQSVISAFFWYITFRHRTEPCIFAHKQKKKH